VTALEQLLNRVLPSMPPLSGCSVKEEGKVFSLRLREGQECAGVHTAPSARGTKGAHQSERCDALFLVRDCARLRPLLMLVELKGGHTRKAIDQLESTFQWLCGATSGIHGNDAIARHWAKAFGENTPHERPVIGIVISPKRLQLKPTRREQLHRRGLKIIKKSSGKALEVSDLWP